jgi:MFS transporter, DHA2 family, multidrug resistance protein
VSCALGLGGTVLSVAPPTLANALHAPEADLQWFSSGYLLVLAAAMLPAGLLGEPSQARNDRADVVYSRR